MYALPNSKSSLLIRTSQWEKTIREVPVITPQKPSIIDSLLQSPNQLIKTIDKDKSYQDELIQLNKKVNTLSAKVEHLEKVQEELLNKLSNITRDVEILEFFPFINNEDYCTENNYCKLEGKKISLIVEILLYTPEIKIYPFADKKDLPKFVTQTVDIILEGRKGLFSSTLNITSNGLYIIDVTNIFDKNRLKTVEFPLKLRCEQTLR